MQIIIVTGMSGAGKSTVLKFLEDIGYFCVDNLPPSLIPKFAEISFRAGSDIDKVALGIDIRGGRLFSDLLPALQMLNENLSDSSVINFQNELVTKILFLDASDETLVKRYKETRRSHPLAKNGRIENGIDEERKLLSKIKDSATFIVDTTHLLTRQLKEQINDIFIENKYFNSLIITVLSFGFKHGIPNDSDLVFDVRFLPNPFYVADMREMTGNDKSVNDYVMSNTSSMAFLDKLTDMISFLLPHYIHEGKNHLVISIGCTGGKHRSVTIANQLFKYLQNNGHSAAINHRDLFMH